jgi:hypothetical protein
MKSRALSSAGYDAETRTLELEFRSGRIYRFSGVPPATYEWLLRSPRKGGYIARMINARYPYEDVTPAPASATRDLSAALRASLQDQIERQCNESAGAVAGDSDRQ